jgi:4-amino-4-deoxy-L-arabinose transferase-like glycosyltransferase
MAYASLNMMRHSKAMERAAPTHLGWQRLPAIAAPRGWSVFAPAFVLILLVILLDQRAYLGGGSDDWHYLQAARCAAEHGFCLPHDHWSQRYLLVGPVGAALALLGESQLTLALVPLLYALGALLLVMLAVRHRYGNAAAMLAGLALAATPAFGDGLLRLNIDRVELALVAAAVLALQHAHDRDSGRWTVLSGVIMGLAIQARPTALAIVPIVLLAILLLRGDRSRPLLWLAGCVAPQAAEAIAYLLWVGDPAYSWKLSLGHVRIPSSELSPAVDLRQSPLLNPAYIAGWKRPMGLSLHWTIDGFLNFVASPAVSLTLAGAALFIALDRRKLGSEAGGGRALLFLLAASALLFATLVYVLAVDPKPRMFLPIIVVACVTFGLLASRNWRKRRLLVAACLTLLLAKGLLAAESVVGPDGAAAAAPAWIEREGDALAIEERSARFLALVPEAAVLPRADGASTRLLLVGEEDCGRAALEAGLGAWQVRRQQRFDERDPRPIGWLRERGLFFAPRATPVMCILGRAGASPV